MSDKPEPGPCPTCGGSDTWFEMVPVPVEGPSSGWWHIDNPVVPGLAHCNTCEAQMQSDDWSHIRP